MTLQEYFNQENPIRMPVVILQSGDYVASKLTRHSWNEERARVYIEHPAIAGIEYSVSINCVRLYTTDKHGNQKQPSCFHLNKPLV